MDNSYKAKKAAYSSDSDDDVPLAKRKMEASVSKAPVIAASKPAPKRKNEDDSDDDVPLAKKINKPVVVKKEPTVVKKAPAVAKKEPTVVKKAPTVVKKEPTVVKKEPTVAKKAPVVKKEPVSAATDDSDDDSSSSEDSSSSSSDDSSSSSDDVDDTTFKSKSNRGGDSDDDTPLSKRVGSAKAQASASKKVAVKGSSGSPKKKSKTKEEKGKKEKKKKKTDEEEEEVYRWWEEEELPEGQKWRTLSHCGPLFPPAYVPLPKNVYLMYEGEPFMLNPAAEEVAGFYAAMLHSDYPKKAKFNENFMKGFRDNMTAEEKKKITKLELCDFSKMQAHFVGLSELRKAASKDEKKLRKEKDEEIKKIYGYALLDGHKQKIGNFRIEPPGLFRGRGEHPKMGLLKNRLRPEDIIVNVSDINAAPVPPAGHKWKEVRCDSSVTWLCSWNENIAGQTKYIMFNAESYLKGRNDMKKYDLARELKTRIEDIRADYTTNLKCKEMLDRQRATSMYLIDKLALRAGGEKDTDEAADTVGCCNLRVEHITLEEDNFVLFDFLGKDSIRYLNRVQVEPQVHKNLKIFMKEPKNKEDQLFDRLNTPLLNKHLHSIMPGLTAKVFRTFNASFTLQEQLRTTPADGNLDEKMLAYNRANRMVAVLCNHQRTVPKGFEDQVAKIDAVMGELKKDMETTKKELKAAAKGPEKDKLKAKVDKLEARLNKKEIEKTNKDEGKSIALGTSKLNYLDPRISVAWCKRFDVPIEKVYNATQRAKFRWAIEMTKQDFVF